MDQNPYESPRESVIKASKPRSTLSGVIQLLMIVVGLMVAIAVLDLIGMSISAGLPIPPIQQR
jgi:hypothetical protein